LWFWGSCRGWLRARLWDYGSQRRYWLRLSNRFLSFRLSRGCFLIGAFNIIGPNYLLSLRYRAWLRFRIDLSIIRGRSNITRMIKQSRIQLTAIERYNTNKSGELTSKATLAIVLGNVAFIHEVVVFIVPSNLSCDDTASRVHASNRCRGYLGVSRRRLPDHKKKKKAYKKYS
jgi:hypothetical protein